MNSARKNLLREYFKLPKRVSRKYAANSNNILKESHDSLSTFWHHLSNYYDLVIKTPPDVTFYHVPEMNITTFSKNILISDDFSNLGKRISDEVKVNIHQDWKQQLTNNPSLNHLRVYFRVRFENDEWRSIKSTEYFSISQLVHLEDNLQEVLEGVQNMEEYDFGDIVEIEAIISYSQLSGGCDKDKHFSVFIIKNMGNIRVSSVKSSNNNCGIDALISRLRKKKIIIKERSKTIRKKLFDHNNSLTIDEIKKVADYLKVDIDILTPLGYIFKTEDKTYSECICLFIYNHHYYLVEEFLPEGQMTSNICVKCKKILKKNHICPVDRQNKINIMVNKINSINNHTIQDPSLEKLKDILFTDNKNIIIHSEGGVGKTYIIKNLIKNIDLDSTKILLLAPTGIAAEHIEGYTIHSIFGIPIDKPFNLNESIDISLKHQIQNIEFIIIDEISMVDDNLLYKIHNILCNIHNNDKPFGGIRVLFSGDFLQLPPVTHKYCFESPIFKRLSLQWIEYTKKYRFNDDVYSQMVSKIRLGKINNEHIKLLKQCIDKPIPDNITPTQLLPKLKDIDKINYEYFRSLESQEIKYPINIKKLYPREYVSKSDLENCINNLYPTQDFKIGCQIMFTKNINDKIKNGTRGIIINCDNLSEKITIKLLDNTIYECKRYNFLCRTSLGNVYLGLYPIKYAWAISIHKSQGLTLDCAIIDLGKDVFDFHMVYVALSRVKSFESLYLKNFMKSSIKINHKVLKFLSQPHEYKILDDNEFNNTIKFTLKNNENKTEIDMKTIYYDVETYTDAQNNIIPYYNYLSVWNIGKEVITQEFILGDNSTDVNFDTFNFIIQLIEKDCIEKNTNNKELNLFYKLPYTVCAYNGSGFDFHFIMNQYLYSCYSEKYELKHIIKDNKLLSIRLVDPGNNRIILRTHDIFNIIGGSLENAVKDFAPEMINNNKDVFPHLLVNNNLNIWLKDSISIDFCDFYNDDLDKVKNLISTKQIDLDKYPIKKKLAQYCKKDVELLISIYRGLDKYLQQILDISIFDFLTTNMISYYGLFMNLPKKTILHENKYKVTTNFPRFTFNQEKYIRESIIGGKAFPRIKKFVSQDPKTDYYTYLDISGMYVSIMKNNRFPLGTPHWGSELELNQLYNILTLSHTQILDNKYFWNSEWEKLPFCILDCDVSLHEYEVEPPVGYKINGKVIWDIKPRRQKYSNISLQLILKNGGTIHKIHSGMIWGSDTEYVFKKWMEKTLELKENGENNNNISLRVLGKLLGNSTYGSMLKRDYHMDLELVRNSEEKDIFLSEHTFDYLNKIKDGLFYIGGNTIDKSNYLTKSPIHLGVFILDYSKVLLDEIIQTINPERRDGTMLSIMNQPLTGDTDSLLIHSRLLPKLKLWIKNENGFLVDELNKHFDINKKGNKIKDFNKMNFTKIIEAYTPMPKAYALRFISSKKLNYSKDNIGYYLIKIKGIPQKNIQINAIDNNGNQKIYSELNFDLIKDLYNGLLNRDSISVISKNRIKKIGIKLTKQQKNDNLQLFQLQSEQLKRQLFKTIYNGREELNNNFTIPWGYNIEQKTYLNNLFN